MDLNLRKRLVKTARDLWSDIVTILGSQQSAPAQGDEAARIKIPEGALRAAPLLARSSTMGGW